MQDEDDEDELDPEAIEMPIGPELDLHTFAPADVASVVEEYVRAAREKGLRELRIVHGKGKGTLRRTVHAVLERHPDVETFAIAGGALGGSGAWGATIARLKP